MQLGLVGLGRMGAAIGERLLRGGHEVAAYNRTPDRTGEIEGKGAQGAYSLPELIRLLQPPRAVWLMVPAGAPVESTIQALLPHMDREDILLDGGNSDFRDSARRAEELRGHGIHFIDVGTSGGIWGLEAGYCLMIGGEAEPVARLSPAFETLAPPGGFLHAGPSGSGHFVKMIHNAVEYGMLQAYGEGFEFLESSEYELDLAAIARLWNRGSVVSSWLLELAERALEKDPDLATVRGFVEDSGEGRWAVQLAVERGIPVPVTALSLFARFASRQDESFSAKVIAALRREFGGHAVKSEPAGSE